GHGAALFGRLRLPALPGRPGPEGRDRPLRPPGAPRHRRHLPPRHAIRPAVPRVPGSNAALTAMAGEPVEEPGGPPEGRPTSRVLLMEAAGIEPASADAPTERLQA